MVIDGHVGELPAGTVDRIASIAGHAVAGPHDATELLDVHVQQFAGCFALVAHDGDHRIERFEARQAQAGQEAADGGHTAAHHRGNPTHGHAGAAQLLDALGKCVVHGVARSLRPGAAVPQSLLVALLEASLPLARRLATDSRGLGRGNQTHHSNAFNEQLAPLDGQSGILMAVHLVDFL
jgi:hypothetical protein